MPKNQCGRGPRQTKLAPVAPFQRPKVTTQDVRKISAIARIPCAGSPELASLILAGKTHKQEGTNRNTRDLATATTIQSQRSPRSTRKSLTLSSHKLARMGLSARNSSWASLTQRLQDQAMAALVQVWSCRKQAELGLGTQASVATVASRLQ